MTEKNLAVPRFTLEVDHKGRGTLQLNGEDISEGVYKVEVLVRAGDLTDVVLYIRGAEMTINTPAKVSYAFEKSA